MLSTSSEREGFSDNNPTDRTPGASERGDKHASSDNHDNADGLVAFRVLSSSDRCEYDEPSSLPKSTDQERPSSTELLDDIQAEEGHENVNGAENELSLDRVVDASTLEDGGAVVEEVVDTCHG